ncbi:hypothetical protein Q3G72_007830 [Acer saccharum]|nr:hypothetical protein Q3G72_007830 [Acer saccharum]
MAKLISHPPSYALLFLFLMVLLLVSTEMPRVEAKLCQRRSKTWSGFCGSTGNCNHQCRNRESAMSGACHAQLPGFACFCYFKC